MKRIIINGSSRTDGNTSLIINELQKFASFDVINLCEANIAPYDYEEQNNEDDFLPMITKVSMEYDQIVFATPIYWYSMSGLLKNFFDRITECLHQHKDIGYQLKGKSMAMVACGSDREAIPGFHIPFELTAGYLGMRYLGDVHTWVEASVSDEVVSCLKSFSRRLEVGDLHSGISMN